MQVPLPRLSIGLPVYNGDKYLRASLDSILRQDYTDYELIISDNASTDETSSICQQYASRDSRIRYFRNQKNIGAAANYRCVFELARGRFFKWATHDDLHLQGFLRRCVEVLEKAPASVVLVAAKTEIIDEAGGRILDWQAESLETRCPRARQRIADVLRKVDWATAQFGIFRVDALRRTRLIDRFHACDYVLLFEVAILGEIWEVPEVLFQRRFHSGVSTNANRTQAALLEWFAPGQGAKGLFSGVGLDLVPRTKLLLEYGKSICRMPLRRNERWSCFFTMLFLWSWRELRRLSREYGTRFRHKVKRALELTGEHLVRKHVIY